MESIESTPMVGYPKLNNNSLPSGRGAKIERCPIRSVSIQVSPFRQYRRNFRRKKRGASIEVFPFRQHLFIISGFTFHSIVDSFLDVTVDAFTCCCCGCFDFVVFFFLDIQRDALKFLFGIF